METNQQEQSGQNEPVIKLDSFQPQDSGAYNRFIERDRIRDGKSNAVAQTLGVKVETASLNANTPYYQGQVDFPQPSVLGFGKVTSAGAKGVPFLSDRWSVVKNSTGIYTITHNIGNTQYVPFIQLIETVGNPRTNTISSITSTTFVVRTFNNAGTATDTDFNFIVYIQ